MHEGHRKRMIDKLLSDPNVLSDHELLEILLFYAIPRKNVNETAHNLLDALGNLQNVFSCDHESLADIDGIGDRSAALFVLINQRKNCKFSQKARTAHQLRDYSQISDRFFQTA